MNIKLIREYIDDHYNAFGFYPCDVDVNGVIYNYQEYWKLLDEDAWAVLNYYAFTNESVKDANKQHTAQGG